MQTANTSEAEQKELQRLRNLSAALSAELDETRAREKENRELLLARERELVSVAEDQQVP